MKAYLRGAKQYAEGMTDRNIAILAKRGNYDAAMLKSVCPPKVALNGEVNADWLLAFQKWAVDKGYIDHVAGREAGLDMWFARQATALNERQRAAR